MEQEIERALNVLNFYDLCVYLLAKDLRRNGGTPLGDQNILGEEETIRLHAM